MSSNGLENNAKKDNQSLKTSISIIQTSSSLEENDLCKSVTPSIKAKDVESENASSDYGEESTDGLEPGEIGLHDHSLTKLCKLQPIPYNPQASYFY